MTKINSNMQARTQAETLRDQIAQEVAALRATKNDLNDQRAALETERNDLLDAPISKDDIKAFIGEIIDAQGALFPSISGMPSLFKRLAYPATRPPTEQKRADGFTAATSPIALRDVNKVLDDPVNGVRIFGSSFDLVFDQKGIMKNGSWGFCFFFGDIIKAKLIEQFDTLFPGYKATDASRIGPPIHERRARLATIVEETATLDSKIAAVDAQLAELRDAMKIPSQAAHAVNTPAAAENVPVSDARSPYQRGQVMQITGLTIGELYNLIEEGSFPKPEWRGDVDFYPALAVDNWMLRRTAEATR